MHATDDDRARAKIIDDLRRNDVHLKVPTYLHLLKVNGRSDREIVNLLIPLEAETLVSYAVDGVDGKVARTSSELVFDAFGLATPAVFVYPAEPKKWAEKGYPEVT